MLAGFGHELCEAAEAVMQNNSTRFVPPKRQKLGMAGPHLRGIDLVRGKCLQSSEGPSRQQQSLMMNTKSPLTNAHGIPPKYTKDPLRCRQSYWRKGISIRRVVVRQRFLPVRLVEPHCGSERGPLQLQPTGK